MNRSTIVFLALLALAALSAGVLSQNAATLFAGRGAMWNWGMVLISAPLFGFALLILGRILYLTTLTHRARGEVSR